MVVPYNGAKRWALTYNKSLPDPTLVASPGDTLNINLKNATNLPTNLHTHGLHVSPAKNSDNPFVQIMPGKDGLVHVSELSEERVNKVSDVVSEGDKVTVKLVAIDDRGRLPLSMKAAKRELEEKK